MEQLMELLHFTRQHPVLTVQTLKPILVDELMSLLKLSLGLATVGKSLTAYGRRLQVRAKVKLS